MAYNDNKDILSWKRLIDAIQTNDKLRVVKESLKEGGVHKLRVDQQTHITAEHHDVVVSSNDMGIIVDIYDKKSDNIDTNTYWNDDVMESKKIKEGTWSVPETPEQVKKLTTLLKNPLDAETALDELYDVFGDDELFDDLEVMKRDEPETDVRHVVIRRLKDMNFIKEVRENAKPTKESLASTTDDLSALEDIVMSYWDRLDDDMKAELNKFWDEPRDTDEIKPFEAKQVEEAVGEFADPIYDLIDDLGASDNHPVLNDLVRYLDGDTIKDFVADFRRNNDLNHPGEDGDYGEDDKNFESRETEAYEPKMNWEKTAGDGSKDKRNSPRKNNKDGKDGMTSKERAKRSWAMIASKDYSDKETVNEDHDRPE